MVIRCSIKVIGKDLYWIPEDSDDPIFAWLDRNGKIQKVDLRNNPPYFQILPCPWCGNVIDKDHKPIYHLHL